MLQSINFLGPLLHPPTLSFFPTLKIVVSPLLMTREKRKHVKLLNIKVCSRQTLSKYKLIGLRRDSETGAS